MQNVTPVWEFFCVVQDGGPRWGWRKRIDGETVEASTQYFYLFIDCNRDAKRNGFEGELNFGPSEFPEP
jgi:hypothetical protein